MQRLKMKQHDHDDDYVELYWQWGNSWKWMATFHQDCLDRELSEDLIQNGKLDVKLEVIN